MIIMLEGQERERFLFAVEWNDTVFIYRNGQAYKVRSWKDAGGYTFVTVLVPKKTFNPY